MSANEERQELKYKSDDMGLSGGCALGRLAATQSTLVKPVSLARKALETQYRRELDRAGRL